MWRLDHAHTGRALLIHNLITECLHSCPMDLRPKMMLGMVSIIKPGPIIQLVVAAHSPGERFVRIAAEVALIPIQVGEAVAEVIERQQETNVMPVQNA